MVEEGGLAGGAAPGGLRRKGFPESDGECVHFAVELLEKRLVN
jgi:hypothetical protein